MTKSGCNAQTPPERQRDALGWTPPALRRVRFYPSYLCGCPSRPSALVRRNLSRRSSLSLIPNKHCRSSPQQLDANELMWGVMLFAVVTAAAAVAAADAPAPTTLSASDKLCNINRFPLHGSQPGATMMAVVVLASGVPCPFLLLHPTRLPLPPPPLPGSTLAAHADSPPPLTCSSVLVVPFLTFAKQYPCVSC